MEPIDQHIKDNLKIFIKNNETFQKNYAVIEYEFKELAKKEPKLFKNYSKKNDILMSLKGEYRELLLYIDNILNERFVNNKNIEKNEDDNLVQFLHLHVDANLSKPERKIILDYLIIKYFNLELTKYKFNREEEINLKGELIQLEEKLESLYILKLPNNISANEINKFEREWNEERERLKNKIIFYKLINGSNKSIPKTLINLPKAKEYNQADILNSRFYGIDINHDPYLKSSVLLNRDKTLEEVCEISDCIENIILFDCEPSHIFNEFNLDDITDYVNDELININKLIIVTFGKKKITAKSQSDIKEKYKNRNKEIQNTYIISSQEINALLGRKQPILSKIKFVPIDSIQFWHQFKDLAREHGELGELYSIKMINIYVLCFNQNIKDLILNSIFTDEGCFESLSEQTKQNIPEDMVDELRQKLSFTLDLIIKSKLAEEIKNEVSQATTVLLPPQVVNNKAFLAELKKELNLFTLRKITTWKDKNLQNTSNLLILCYQDIGNYRYNFYPNIIELQSQDAKCIFLNFFYENLYNWAIYNYINITYNNLNHQIRKDNFEWDELKYQLKKLKPQRGEETTNWKNESSYNNTNVKQTIKIYFFETPDRFATFNTSDLFVCRINNNLKILKSDKLLKINSLPVELQNLSELIDAMPIDEKLADINNQKIQLKIIKEEFKIKADDEKYWLWKVLLKRKLKDKNSDELHAELKGILEKKKLKIVRLEYFKDNWLNLESELITPKQNKVFVEVCNYIGLEKKYGYIPIIQRLKNKIKQASRSHKVRWNTIFIKLFEDGCFVEVSKTEEILDSKIEQYKAIDFWDELGVEDSNLLKTLVDLVKLFSNKMKLKKIKKIELIENEYYEE